MPVGSLNRTNGKENLASSGESNEADGEYSTGNVRYKNKKMVIRSQ